MELNDHLLEVDRLKSDSQQLLEHNGRLQEVADQHQELKGTYNQLLSRSVFLSHTYSGMDPSNVLLQISSDGNNGVISKRHY